MIQWKHLQLSSEDYENFINNEDPELMKINDLNLNEWQELYHTVQIRSLNNKQLKSKILSYENNLKRLTSDTELHLNKKEVQRQYHEFSSELKIRLSELYNQLDMLHLSNVSTTVELIISRLLSIQEDLVLTASQNSAKIKWLQHKLEDLQYSKKLNICSQCLQHIEKTKYKYLKNQIMAVQEPSQEETAQSQEDKSRQVKKYMREEMTNEESQYEVKRIHYLYQLQQALRNKEKTLQYTNTPLQSILEDYLHHILEILEAKKVNFAPKNINEYGRVSQSYEVLEEMKKLFNHKQFRKNITDLLEQPFANFGYRIKKSIQKSIHQNESFTLDTQTQTSYIKQFQLIANMEKQINRLTLELEAVRTSKNKMENDLISNLQTFHKYQLKSMELNNRNKQYQSQIARLQVDVQTFKKKYEEGQNTQKFQRNNLIQSNLTEKGSLVHEIRKLQGELRKLKTDKMVSLHKIVDKSEGQAQTDQVNFQQPFQVKKQNLQYVDLLLKKSYRKGKLKNKSFKRISIEMERRKNYKVSTLLKPETEQAAKRESLSKKKKNQMHRASQESRNLFSRDNFSKRLPKKTEKEGITLKINTINPSRPFREEDIKQMTQELDRPKYSHFRAESSVLIGESKNSSRIKKISEIRGHAYHKSEFGGLFIESPSTSNLELPVTNRVDRKLSNRAITINKVLSSAQFFPQHDIQNLDVLGQNIASNNRSRILIGEETERQNKQLPLLKVSGKSFKKQKLWKGPNFHNLNKVQTEFLQNFIQFCIIHYQFLQKNKVFDQIYHLEPNIVNQKGDKENIKRTDINQSDQIPLEISYAQKSKVNLQLFISIDEAKKYENKTGFWGQIDNCIMVDNYFSKESEKIQTFFNDLKVKRPEVYAQYAQFLINPVLILSQKEQNIKQYPQNLPKLVSPRSASFEPGQIKQIFKKLLRIHKLVHRRCNHVWNFLGTLGFSY